MMKSKRISLIVFWVVLSGLSFIRAQNISGFVYDTESEEPIIGAVVYCESNNIGAITNNFGFFSMNIYTHDTTSLRVSYLGYKTKIIPLNKVKNPLRIFLERETFDLQEVIVTADKLMLQKSGTTSLTMEQISKIPSLIGEADVLKAFQLLPGIQGGSEGSVGLNVRGGSNDQNLYLLDGVPLYYVNHIGGISSVFDVLSVKSAVLYKGFFPASYGGRLSSVMDVVMKDGNMNETKKEITVGTLTSKFFIEGGLGRKRRTTYIASARICNIGLITLLNNNGAYFYYDLNSKITHRIDNKNKLYFSFYMGDDSYHKKDNEKHSETKSKYKSRTTFGNEMASVKWFHVFGSDINSDLMLTYSKFNNHTNTDNKYYSGDTKVHSKEDVYSTIRDIRLKGNLDHWKFNNHRLKAGFVSSLQSFRPQVLTFKQKDAEANLDSTILHKTTALQSDIYVEDHWMISEKTKIYAGLRLSSFLQKGTESYVSLEPRLSLTLYPFQKTSICLGYSKMSQYVHLLTNSDGGIPKDLWVPSTNKIFPEQSNQYELEIKQNLLSGYHLTFNLYYKKMHNLIEYIYYVQANNHWEDNVEVGGKGISKGVECTLSKETGIINGFISYSCTKSTRKFEQINRVC